jgi:Family of unknown function (DUF6644)
MADFIRQSLWFPVIQSVHMIGLTLLVGTVSLVDFRLLGIGMRRHTAAEVASALAAWTWAGLLTVAVTGPLMFWSDLTRYPHNPAFLAKMVLLAMALAGHLTLHRRVVAESSRKDGPAGGRLAAALSLVLWSSVVVAARLIADFDVIRPD